jgi:hypothetical protein
MAKIVISFFPVFGRFLFQCIVWSFMKTVTLDTNKPAPVFVAAALGKKGTDYRRLPMIRAS